MMTMVEIMIEKGSQVLLTENTSFNGLCGALVV
jgi:hypothetical protein